METATISTKVDTSYKQILQLSLPIWASIMITQISFFTNTFFLGKIGEAELAANGVAGIFYLVLTMVCVGFNNGVQLILSRRAGQEDKLAYGNVFSNAIVLGFIFSIVIALSAYFIGPYLFNTQVHNQLVAQLSAAFIIIRIMGLPIYFLQQLGNQFFISTQNTRYILYGMITSTVVNILFDYIFILGKFGMPQMGIKGAALAGILADFSFLCSSYFFAKRKQLLKEFHIKFFVPINKALSKETIQLASPVILQYLLSIGSWEVFFIYIEHLGQKEAAITQILRSVFGIVGGASWAYASTCNSMVSNLIGQQKHDQVFPIIKKIATLSFITCVPFSLLYLCYPSAVLHIYSADTNLINLAIPALKIVVIANLLLSISTIVFNGVLGTGNTTYSMAIEFIAIIFYLIYIYYVIEKYKLNLSWAWGSEFLYWTSLLIMSLAFFKWVNWKSKVI
jgi:multidrug resistance protein, MATE family